jgi:arylsulfatase A-like enzyme
VAADNNGVNPQSTRREFFALSGASLLGAACGEKVSPEPEVSAGPPPNVVVFVADALRADHLSCYGHTLPTTPAIDAFSKKSALFGQCYAGATWTTPATASLLTGTPALLHRTVTTEWSEDGIEENRFQILPTSTPTTAECLEKKGYTTGYFQANPNAVKPRGHARGCQHYYFGMNAPAAEHMDEVLRWLREEAREPFYAYIHLIDPHEPYQVDPAIFEELTGQTLSESIASIRGAEKERLGEYHSLDWKTLFLENKRLNPDELVAFSASGIEHFAKLYDTEILGIDHQFRRLLQGLQEMGFEERAVVVVTSDHGEALGDDGEFYHGSSLHDPQTHVPLIVRVPGQEAGRVVPWTVGQIDVHPTLLTVAGVDIPEPCVGRSLLSRQGELLAQEDRPVLTSLDYHRLEPNNWDFGLIEGTLRVRSSGSFTSFHAFHSSTKESSSVSQGAKEFLSDSATARAVERLYSLKEEYSRISESLGSPEWGYKQVDEDTTFEMFRALGYV